MALRELLRPTRQKLLADFLISSAWLLLVFSIPWFGFEPIFSSYDLQKKFFILLLNLAAFLLFYYPASCGLVFIYRRTMKKGASNAGKRDLAAAVFFIIAVNPVSVSLVLMGANYFDHEVVNRPCGLEVTGFPDYSPARDAGMNIGEIIVEVEGLRVDTSEALGHALGGKRVGDIVSVKTEKGEYKIPLAENPEKHSPVLGLNLKQRYCSR